ncbi:MAG TPA: hypothetical protein VHQ23_04635 [Ilumatobacteraceae bacterium]|nr:hypothetical protein [Ilumatobacteraceae bacterium]
MNESQDGDVRLLVGHTSDFDPEVLSAARDLLYVVFDDMTDDDWEHALGGVHAIAWHNDAIIGHASVRWVPAMRPSVSMNTADGSDGRVTGTP